MICKLFFFHAKFFSDVSSVDHASNFSEPVVANNVVPTTAPKAPSVLIRPIWDAPPRTVRMLPLKKFRLTKELVQQRVKDNTIIVTFGNYAFMDFILTWVKHLTDLGLTNVLVGKLYHLITSRLIFIWNFSVGISYTFSCAKGK